MLAFITRPPRVIPRFDMTKNGNELSTSHYNSPRRSGWYYPYQSNPSFIVNINS